MKNIIPIILILLFLVSSCAVPQPNSADIKLNVSNKTEDIVKPIITENKTIDEKEKINESKPQVLSAEQICIEMGGGWFYFPNTCIDSCTKSRSKEPVLCGQAFTWGCECGTSKCWNGTGCEPTLHEESLASINETIENDIPTECGDFLSNEHVMFGYPSKERLLERQA